MTDYNPIPPLDSRELAEIRKALDRGEIGHAELAELVAEEGRDHFAANPFVFDSVEDAVDKVWLATPELDTLYRSAKRADAGRTTHPIAKSALANTAMHNDDIFDEMRKSEEVTVRSAIIEVLQKRADALADRRNTDPADEFLKLASEDREGRRLYDFAVSNGHASLGLNDARREVRKSGDSIELSKCLQLMDQWNRR